MTALACLEPVNLKGWLSPFLAVSDSTIWIGWLGIFYDTTSEYSRTRTNFPSQRSRLHERGVCTRSRLLRGSRIRRAVRLLRRSCAASHQSSAAGRLVRFSKRPRVVGTRFSRLRLYRPGPGRASRHRYQRSHATNSRGKRRRWGTGLGSGFGRQLRLRGGLLKWLADIRSRQPHSPVARQHLQSERLRE